MVKHRTHRSSRSMTTTNTDVSLNIPIVSDAAPLGEFLIPKVLLGLGLITALILFLYYLLNPEGWMVQVNESNAAKKTTAAPTSTTTNSAGSTTTTTGATASTKLTDAQIAGIVIGSLLGLMLLFAIVMSRTYLIGLAVGGGQAVARVAGAAGSIAQRGLSATGKLLPGSAKKSGKVQQSEQDVVDPVKQVANEVIPE